MKRIIIYIMVLSLIIPVTSYFKNVKNINIVEISALDDITEETSIYEGNLTDTIQWSFDETSKTLIISGTGDMPNYDYKSETPWKEYINKIKKVIINDGITSVGDNIFRYYSVLQDVSLAESITYIGECTFYGCSSLVNINIPKNLKSFGVSAFSYCTSLGDVTIPSSVDVLPEVVFSGCYTLSSATICEGVSCIGSGAFEDTVLREITIPRSVTIIERLAFYNCLQLNEITIPSSVTSIGDFAIGYYNDVSTNEIYKVSGFTIYGVSGSEAERYALENDFNFIEIEETPSTDIEYSTIDLLELKKYLLGIKNIDGDNTIKLDLNHDSYLNIFDLITLKDTLLNN